MARTKKQITASKPDAQPKALHVAKAEWLEKIDNPWTEVPKFQTSVNRRNDYITAVNHCRFFYKAEPLVSTVIDKLVEIGVTDLMFDKNKLSDNEFRVFEALKPRLADFAEQMATEYLLSGLVVPEVGYGKVDKDFLFTLGVKKYSSLELPETMWVRDPKTINIKTTFVGDKPSYFVKVPTDVVSFIKSKGTYPDGTKDPDLYEVLVTQYPDFVKAIVDGETEMLLDNDNVLRRKYTSDNPYPIPYIQSALEALHHKRKLRRMDYSLIDKVMSAIMHVKLGDKDYPITQSEEDQKYVEDITSQLRMRGTSQSLLERVFQLVTNHTVDIQWIFPETKTLLDVEKYKDINEEILFALGFPRVLITGEAQRSGTSDSEIATMSPIKTAEGFRRKVIEVIQDVCLEVSKRNNFNSVPRVTFKAINLHKFADFVDGLRLLWDTSAISRTSLDEEFGREFSVEVDLLKNETDTLKANGLSEFGPTPNSKNSVLMQPDQQGNPQPDNTNKPNQPTGNQPAGGKQTAKKPKQPAKTASGE